MGENANDIIVGACCALCGIYFVSEHDMPVVCEGCYEIECGYEKAWEEEA